MYQDTGQTAIPNSNLERRALFPRSDLGGQDDDVECAVRSPADEPNSIDNEPISLIWPSVGRLEWTVRRLELKGSQWFRSLGLAEMSRRSLEIGT